MDLLGNMHPIYLITARRARKFRKRINNYDKWSHEEFFHRFRVHKETFCNILSLVQTKICNKSNRNQGQSARDKLLLTLRFFATGSMLITIGDFVGVHKSTASRTIKLVSAAIASLRPQFIKFPMSRIERLNAAKDMYKLARFPRAVGAIDCTHVKIESPGGENAEIFRNRKGYFSINVQTVSSHNLKTLDIVARWPGGTHDTTIFNSSRLKRICESSDFKPFCLLGDKGYALREYMMTPLSNPGNRGEKLYQESQIRTRNAVERQYGVIKRRFPILSIGIKVNINTAMAIIVACNVLHKIAIDAKDPVPEDDPEIVAVLQQQIVSEQLPLTTQQQNQENMRSNERCASIKGKFIRDNLIENYFSKL